MTTNFYDDISPFFSNDGRGVQFVHFNYKGNEYESSLNTAKNSDSIIGEPLFQLMISNNYLSKRSNQNNNDIHQEFVDFIIKTALSHRNLDKPSINVVNVMENVNLVDIALEKISNDEFKKSLSDILTYISNTPKLPNLKNKKLLDTIIKMNSNKLPDVIIQVIKRFMIAYKIYDSDITYFKSVIIPSITKGVVNTIIETKNDSTLKSKGTTLSDPVVTIFKTILIDNLIESLQKSVKAAVPPGLKSLSKTSGSSSVFDKVKQLKNLNDNARKFYLTNFVILEKNADGSESLFYDLDRTDDPTRTLRLNFKKSPSNKLRTVFSNSLPFVPSICEKLYFTNDSNNVESITLSNLNENDRKNILRIIYDNVYSSGNIFKLLFNGKEQTFNVNLKQPTQPNFQVNYSKLISSIINNFGKFPSKSFDNFDDLFLDMSTDILYKKDDKGLFRQVDSETRMYYDSSKFDNDIENNCYGTYLNDPSADCKIGRILLNNTPENLVRYLATLKNEALFEVAKSDIQNINPEIMKNIVNTFGFIVRKESDGVYRPAAFNDWIKSSKVNDEIKNVVVNNKKLSIYLSEILNILRKNPVLFNQNVPLANPSHPNIGLSVFNTPLHMERPKRNIDLSSMMLRTNGEQKLEMPFFLNLQNVGFQTGGGIMNENNSDKIKQMFNQLFMQLEHNGKELKNEDKERINKVVETATKLETQLNQMYEEIQLYSNLQEMLKDTNVVEGVELSEIHDITTNRTRLEETMQKIRDKIQKNLVTQQKVFQTLYLIQDPLVRLISFP
jgi:hypothetical protein